ncbi:glycosyltransferase [Algoriphagus sp. PAP.12]|uniref:glycosyltransferase n=1 Tax=Algoriphagus sp. PAP.12 TaxID=2996678 RepID=UPI00227CAC27|nr:glycosyltransferase [Algoriphagus sp. PAP.12]
MEKRYLTLVIPQHNDWESLADLLSEINSLAKLQVNGKVSVVIVDDFSESLCPFDIGIYDRLELQTVRIVQNIGHQRAIAIGLCYVFDHFSSKWVGVLDADGEDRPVDFFRMVEAAKQHSQSIFAKRTKRSEGFLFKLFYWIYKIIFWFSTGRKIDFGNFSVIEGSRLKALVHDANLWNNYAVAFLKSKIPFDKLSTERGKRYYGKSRMNITGLIIHGLSGIAVFVDVVTTRVILFSLSIILLAMAGIGVVVGIRFGTDLAIPGWATYSVLAFGILLFQALIISFFTLFIFLSNRSTQAIQPIKEYSKYID